MMTTDKEIIEEYRQELQIKIDIFIWTLGEKAVTEMTKTVREWPEQNKHQPAILTIPPSFYTRKKQVSQSGRFLRNSARTERNGWRSLD